MSRMEVHSFLLSVCVCARARVCVCFKLTITLFVKGGMMLVTIATATVSCCYQVPGMSLIQNQLYKNEIYSKITTTLQTLNATCSLHALVSRALTFWSHLLEQIHQSRPLGPVVIKHDGEGQDTLALCSIHTFTVL